MASQQQIDAARANGARSRGPTTPEGKAKSSQNALKHGLLSKWIVLRDESPEGFEELRTGHIERFRPRDQVEMEIIDEMCIANWRTRRAWAMETRLIDEATGRQPKDRGVTQMANAFSE